MSTEQPWTHIRVATLSDWRQVLAVDDDATLFYAEVGVVLALTNDHPFAVDEQARWHRSLVAGRLFVAQDAEGRVIGFASLDTLDDEPYLDQLSVRRESMRRGVGSALLEAAAEWARAQGADCLWLTTYGHVAHNRPFYERRGFVVVDEAACGAGVLHHIEEQRRWLPAPEHRVAMVRSLM